MWSSNSFCFYRQRQNLVIKKQEVEGRMGNPSIKKKKGWGGGRWCFGMGKKITQNPYQSFQKSMQGKNQLTGTLVLLVRCMYWQRNEHIPYA